MHCKNMADISRKTYERNGVETVLDNDGILWLHENYIEEELDHKNFLEFATKYHSSHRKHNFGLVDETNKTTQQNFYTKGIRDQSNTDCKTTVAYKLRTRVGFKQYDVILTNEQSVLIIRKSLFEGESIQTQHGILSYRIDVYLHYYKVAIKIENGHKDRNIDYKIKKTKSNRTRT